MKAKKLLSVLLCLVLMLSLLPVGAAAAGVSYVSIAGMALTTNAPYYFIAASGQDASTDSDPHGDTWNAYLEIDGSYSTLHLKDLIFSSPHEKSITVTGISTLYIELEGANTVTNESLDSGSYGISAPDTTKLVIYSKGSLTGNSLTVNANNGTGISINSSGSIELQYPATLTVKGWTKATDKVVSCITSAYDAKGGDNVTSAPIDGYNSAYPPTATGYKHIVFAPKSTAEFPVWVGSTPVTSAKMGDVLSDGKVTYTPAHGSAQATLTLNGANITAARATGSHTAGIYAREALDILLKGTNSIETTNASIQNLSYYGIYSEKALTITAETRASLNAHVFYPGGTSASPYYTIYAEGGITLDNCRITLPDNATWKVNNGKNIYPQDSAGAVLENVTISVPAPPPPPPVIIYPTAYTLSFEENGGTEVADLVRVAGSGIDLSSYAPTREHYAFLGWHADEACTQKVESVTLSKNTTVYALWQWINPFRDVSEADWFYDGVECVYANGVFKGVTDTVFAPEAPMTRAMLLAALWRMEGSPVVNFAMGFTDVPQDEWYAEAVRWAASEKLAEGYDAEHFGPGDSVTREQMAVFLYRYALCKEYDVTASSDLGRYSDSGKISPYAAAPMSWANACGLINGKGGLTLDPLGSATRCEAAAILRRFCEKIVK